MEKFFDIRYEFDKEHVWNCIDRQIASGMPDYICVADGVVVNHEFATVVGYLCIFVGFMVSVDNNTVVP